MSHSVNSSSPPPMMRSSHWLIASLALGLAACSDDSPSADTDLSFTGGSLGAADGTPAGSSGLGGAHSPTPTSSGGPGAGGATGGGSPAAPAVGSRGGSGDGTAGGGGKAAASTAGAGGLGPEDGAGGNGGAGDGATSGGGGTRGGGNSASGGAPAGGAPASGGASSGGAATNTPLTIWIAGDSTVANGNTPCPRGWGRSLESKFGDQVSVVNSAVGGRSVRTWLYSVTQTMGSDGECVLNNDGNGKPILQERWTTMLSKMAEGDTLLIQFGINDGSKTCDRHVGTNKFKEEYAMMARAAKEREVQPIFITPVSAIKCSGSKAVGTRGFLKATREVAKSESVPVIDLHQRSIDLYNKRRFCPLPSGNSDVSASTRGAVGEFFCDDHTHFSDLGQPAIAELVVDGLKELGVPLADYLK